MLDAHLWGKRRPLDDRALAALALRDPLSKLKVTAAIHWHALRLWRKPFSQERDRLAGPDANKQKRGQVSRTLRAELEKAIADVKEALKGSDAAAIKSANEKLTEAWHSVKMAPETPPGGPQPGAEQQGESSHRGQARRRQFRSRHRRTVETHASSVRGSHPGGGGEGFHRM